MLVLRCPEAGTSQRGTSQQLRFPRGIRPSSAPVEPGEEPALVVAVQKPRAGDASSLRKVTPAGVWGCQFLRLSLKTGPCCSCTSSPGRGPSSPLSGQPGRPGLAYLCPCSLNVSQCRWRLLNLVREGRGAVSRLPRVLVSCVVFSGCRRGLSEELKRFI